MQSLKRTVGSIMRAVRVTKFGGPEVLQVQTDVPIPEPKDDEVLIKVSAAGVNPVDTYIRAGTYHIKPTLPYTPGADVAGVVEKTGAAVKLFKPGDRVFTVRTSSGAYAEYATALEQTTFPLADRLSFVQGAGAGIASFTAYRALFHRCRAKPSETVLVHGASGGVGLAACQLARAHGMTVIGTAGSAEGMQLVKNHGAHFVFNHREEGYLQSILGTADGDGVDVVLEMLANVNLDKDFQITRQHGHVAIIGNRGTIEINPRSMMARELNVHGVMLFGASSEEWKEMRAAVCQHLEQGSLQPYIGGEYQLEKASQAHLDIINTSATSGKNVITM